MISFEGLFWLAILGVAYSYFVYPIILLAINGLSRPHQASKTESPEKHYISLIVTVHNEESRIAEKIQNSLQIDYPKDKLELIIASDCSTDGTNAIVEEYADKGVRLVRVEEHNGKEFAQWQAIKAALGEILVFSDVATNIPENALELIDEKMQDQAVGALSSEDRFISDDGKIAGEGAYVKYEMWLRKLESEAAGLVGLSGSFFAARKKVCEYWDTKSPSDFNTALNCADTGLRAISCPDILGYYKDIKDSSREYQRKVRTVLRGITALGRRPRVLNPLRYGLFSFQVWSHKVMRWAVPWFMLLALLSNIAIAGHQGFYCFTLVAQLLGYFLIVIAHYQSSLRDFGPMRIAYFFVQVNLAIAHATVKYFTGVRQTTWTPSAR